MKKHTFIYFDPYLGSSSVQLRIEYVSIKINLNTLFPIRCSFLKISNTRWKKDSNTTWKISNIKLKCLKSTWIFKLVLLDSSILITHTNFYVAILRWYMYTYTTQNVAEYATVLVVASNYHWLKKNARQENETMA